MVQVYKSQRIVTKEGSGFYTMFKMVKDEELAREKLVN